MQQERTGLPINAKTIQYHNTWIKTQMSEVE